MKKFKVIWSLCLIAALTLGAFAFTTKAAKTITTLGWYVMDQGTDPADPNSYSYRANFDPQTEGCLGTTTVCAIKSDGDGVHPAISDEPQVGVNVDEILYQD
jgi:hypothetical protein